MHSELAIRSSNDKIGKSAGDRIGRRQAKNAGTITIVCKVGKRGQIKRLKGQGVAVRVSRLNKHIGLYTEKNRLIRD